MIDILRCLLQGNDVLPACNLLFEGIFFSAFGPWIPVVDTEPLLHNRTIREMVAGTVGLRGCSSPPF